MVRKAMRLTAVLAATGYPRSTLYLKIAQKKFPAGTKLDPEGRATVWWEDEILAFQNAALRVEPKVAA